jgi:hypothetical protein
VGGEGILEGRSGVKPTTPKAGWPSLLERLLRRVAGEAIAEAARGDLEEESAALRLRYGTLAARLWIALQVVRLILQMMPHSLPPWEGWFREVTMDTWTSRRRRFVAIVGALAALPAAVLVVGGLFYSLSASRAVEQALDSTIFDTQSVVYRALLHPVTVLGGLALALGLNLIPLLRIRLDRQPGNLTGTLAVRLRSSHLAVAAFALGLCAVILAYAFTENFAVVPRPPAASKVSAAVAVGAGWTAVRRANGDWMVREVGASPADLYLEIPEPDFGRPLSCRAWSVDLPQESGATSNLTLALDCLWNPTSN